MPLVKGREVMIPERFRAVAGRGTWPMVLTQGRPFPAQPICLKPLENATEPYNNVRKAIDPEQQRPLTRPAVEVRHVSQVTQMEPTVSWLCLSLRTEWTHDKATVNMLGLPSGS